MLVNRKDIIPEHFNSAEEAGEFWDSHSAADYWNEMEEEEIEFECAEPSSHYPIGDPQWMVENETTKPI
ncbi:MAG: hypothetical protein AAGB97_09340, partial [Dehalococcoidia bacterium]